MNVICKHIINIAIYNKVKEPGYRCTILRINSLKIPACGVCINQPISITTVRLLRHFFVRIFDIIILISKLVFKAMPIYIAKEWHIYLFEYS